MRLSVTPITFLIALTASSMTVKAQDMVCPTPEERQALLVLALRSQVLQVSTVCVEAGSNRPFEDRFAPVLAEARQDASKYFIRRYNEDASDGFHDYENDLSLEQSVANVKKGFSLCHWADDEFPRMLDLTSQQDIASYAAKQGITLSRAMQHDCPDAASTIASTEPAKAVPATKP